MSRLADVFEVIESLKSDKVIVDYAIAGATAVLVYAEIGRASGRERV